MAENKYIGGEFAKGSLFFTEKNTSTEFFPKKIGSLERSLLLSGSDSLAVCLNNWKPYRLLFPGWYCYSAIERAVKKARLSEKIELIAHTDVEQFNQTGPGDMVVLLHPNKYNENLGEFASSMRKRGVIAVEDFVLAPFDIKRAQGNAAFNSMRKVGDLELSVLYSEQGYSDFSPGETSLYFERKKHAAFLKKNFLENGDIDLESVYLKGFQEAEQLLHEAVVFKAPQSEALRLEGLDVPRILSVRRKNFELLSSMLPSIEKGPEGDYMFYMVLVEDNAAVRSGLSKENIFAPIHWPDAPEGIPGILSLPIDQRYGPEEMKRISSAISRFV